MIKITGQFDMGKKSGIWSYTLNGRIIQKYNYDIDKIVYHDGSSAFSNFMIVHIDQGPDVNPILIGGQAEYFDHVLSKLSYPTNARRKGIQGIVYVSFTISKEGEIIDEQIEKGIGGGCDEEALRVIKSFNQRFIPAIYKGEAVDVRVIAPLTFKID